MSIPASALTPTPVRKPWQHALAIVGIVIGLIPGLLLGLVAYESHKKWRNGQKRSPTFAWFLGVFFPLALTGDGIAYAAGVHNTDSPIYWLVTGIAIVVTIPVTILLVRRHS